jgi:hypothetical protein
MKKLKYLFLACVILVLTAYGRPCAAAVQLMLDDGSNPAVVVLDGGPDDMNAAIGAVTWMMPLGVWSVGVSTGVGSPALGSLAHPKLALGAVQVSTGSGTLKLKLTQTDNFGPISGVVMAIGGTLNLGGSVVYNSYADSSNTPFGTSEPLTSQVFGTTPFAGAAGSTILASASAPYSLTQEVVITHTSPGATTFGGTLFAAPEPTALMTWGGLALIAFGFWRTQSWRAARAA